MDAWIVLALLVVAVALLVSERVRPDLVAMLTLTAVMLLGLLAPEAALAGFSSPATVTVACMFVLSAGLTSSGFVGFLGDRLLAHGPKGEFGLLLLVALVVAPISAFINNTAAVAIFLPVLLRACHGAGLAPSRLLMPLAFLAILGGTCTLIGTSTNILVSSMARARGLTPFSMFELTPVGLLFLGIGAAYLLTLGRRLLPFMPTSGELPAEYNLGAYITEALITKDSPLIGMTLGETRLGERFELEVLGIGRKGEAVEPAPEPGTRLGEGDILLIKAAAGTLARVHREAGLTLRPARRTTGPAKLRRVGDALFEVIVQPNSPLEGRTLKGINFRATYGATVLAIRHRGEDIVEKIGLVPLREGDELLVLMPRRNLDRLRREPGLVLMGEVEVPEVDARKAAIAVAIIAAVVGIAAAGLYPIVVTAVAGSVVMVVTGCLPVRRVYESIDWKVIFLLAGVIPLGTALESSGAATQVVDFTMGLLEGAGPRAILGGFSLLTLILTGLMSNNATAALMVPLALGVAGALDVDERPFLVAIMFSASAAFWTPFGYQTNLLVYAPGGYRFADYLRVGLPLNAVYLVLSIFAIPRFFPF